MPKNKLQQNELQLRSARGAVRRRRSSPQGLSTKAKIDLRAKLTAIIRPSQKIGIPPQMKLAVSTSENILLRQNFDRDYKYYDVSSMTKALVTVPLIMKLYEEKRVELNKPISKYLAWLARKSVGAVLISDLLCHHSGLEWWRPYHQELLKIPVIDRDRFLKHKFVSEKVIRQNRCVYSDLDFILLGWVVEEMLGMPLDEAAAVFIFQPLGLNDSFFIKPTLQDNRSALKIPNYQTPTFKATGRGVTVATAQGFKNIRRTQFAPTLKAQPRGLVQGEVFDDNAFSLNGVAGHAGLFSTLDDVTRLSQEFLKIYNGKKNSLWSPSTMRKFAKRAVKVSQGDWSLGFYLPTMPTSNAGSQISPVAFGHWAFPGPSFWIDPTRNAIAVILANRTYPNYKDPLKYKRFLALRREIHDAIWEAFG